MKIVIISALIIIVLSIGFILGPQEKAPKLTKEYNNKLPNELVELENYIAQREKQVKNLKKDNQARFIWANPDSITKTEIAFVYLHGFSASPQEGNGLYSDLHKKYHGNIYIPRLQAHGIKSKNELLDFDIAQYWQSAQEAYFIGKKIGKKLIIIGNSTGSSLALMLAAEYKNITGLLLFSPNIDVYDPKAKALTYPWGLQLARFIMGSKYYTWQPEAAKIPYWNAKYRIEALIRMKVMLDAYMTKSTFQKIDIPVFVGYYYKNKKEHDKTISIEAAKKMFNQLSTAPDKKKIVAFPNAPGHVMLFKPTATNLKAIKKESFDFIDKVINTNE